MVSIISMKAAIYSPYLDTLGGGEKYMMTVAEVFSENAEVDVLLDKHLESIGKDKLKDKLSERFGLNLKKTNFILGPVGEGSDSLTRLSFLKQYEILFYLTDGSIFYPTAKKNILHIQTPLVGQPAKSLWGRLKLKGWNQIIYNSQFTKNHSEKNWPISSTVIYPPVDTAKIKPLKKKKYILSVGRFFSYLKDKKHEVLIKAFKELYETGEIKDWSLNLAGSAGEGDKDYVEDLKNMAKGIPINFYPNIGYDDLKDLYGQSSIYWHGAGFGEDDPTRMEHFGISTVEAMAGGCVPVVINKGGQVEIMDSESGFLWNTIDELKKYTLDLIRDEKLRVKLSEKAETRAKNFNKEIFAKKIKELI